MKHKTYTETQAYEKLFGVCASEIPHYRDRNKRFDSEFCKLFAKNIAEFIIGKGKINELFYK